MTDKQETNDEVSSISSKLQAITTADPNLNHNEQLTPNNDQQSAMGKPKNTNNTLSNVSQDRKNKSLEIDGSWMSSDLPGINLPERIVFIIDNAREENCTPFMTRNGQTFSPISMIKRVIEIFVNVKLGIQDRHEFAFMIMEPENAMWVCDFTNDLQKFLTYLRKIEESFIGEEQEIYDLGPCFEKIYKNTVFDHVNGIPTHVTRVILIYARSYCIPQFITGRHFFDALQRSSDFFFDSLYVHEPLSDENNCQEIYAKLATLDINRTSFIFEVGRNPANLHTNMAKLTAHPLQRAPQDTAFGNNQENQTNV